MKPFRDWFHRYLSDPQAVILAFLLGLGTVIILTLGRMLAPVLASLVIAYLLQGPVARMERLGLPRLAAVSLVFLLFMAVLVFILLGLLPLLSRQVGQFLHDLPAMIAGGQQALLRLPERYPDFVTEAQLTQLMATLRAEVMGIGQHLLSLSLASVLGLLTLLVYLVLMPLLVFFFLKDKERILAWVTELLPEERGLAAEVWAEMDRQLGNYIRGKVWEILIVWTASTATFAWLGLKFSMLLGLFVGLSVLIPYVGATVMTFPVALIAYSQWGWSADFAWTVAAYLVIQVLDGNLLVPLLLSEVVNLHPVAIIVAILVFGGLWGLWGVFFAIPLATLVHSVIRAWQKVGARKAPAAPAPEAAGADA
ncbi:AI-2E family transporter [Dissulfurirhabdus thermomarina]|uniref:AI-2E family transporter n=1 Tax=Dissulfurirhabdus thermomarina TaxID=1765737 RepID=A0A6N9TRL7_DISTH|nr:AI-2E family transporter [Dissulfurirhabdus thermomarina]NDY43070.1 AI-2E family transporter [Dissulfurirhabdus thermomarina]NMX22383.1 AI-2E family transporter [Dissulfurirhabdus thermomarina]